MKSKKKVFLTVLCAAALVVASVLGTMAFLTSQTGTVNNTFTVGKVQITLDEAKVTAEGVKDGDTRVQGNGYKLIPGHNYVKDPTVHVDANSEKSYLFVKVENSIAGLEAADTDESKTSIAAQMDANGWKLVTGETNVYYYKTTVKANDNIKVFNSFTLADDANVASVTNNDAIKITAYAVQVDGFSTAAEAWAAAPTNWQ